MDDIGEHTNTERGYLTAALKPALEKLLTSENIDVIVSKVDKDPLVIMQMEDKNKIKQLKTDQK